MSTPKANKMLMLINYRMRVTLHDARVLVGRFMAFDKHMNLVRAPALGSAGLRTCRRPLQLCPGHRHILRVPSPGAD